MAEDRSVVDFLSHVHVIDIATERRAGGEVSTPIWVVVVDGAAYVRGEYGNDSNWYRRARRDGRATFLYEHHRFPVTVEAVTDDGVIDRIDEAYRTKYALYGEPLRRMLAPELRPFTVRVIPR